MTATKKYEPANFLLTNIKAEGSDLVELAGIATGYQYSERRIPGFVIDDMEKAVEKAKTTIASYRRAVEKNIEVLSREEFAALNSNQDKGR